MGSRGPAPKRTEERRRRNKPDPADKVETVVAPGDVKIPNANSKWCASAKRMWTALKESAQRTYWEPSDWEAARMALDMYSAEMAKDKPTAALVKLSFKILADMGLTESDRRRMRIEVKRVPKPKPEGVTSMEAYRAARLAKG